MKDSVRKGGALESARNRLFARLHSYFMAELKPAHERQTAIGRSAVEKGKMVIEPTRLRRLRLPTLPIADCLTIVQRSTGLPVS